LNIELGINDKRQDYEIDTVCVGGVLLGEERVNKED
jgi:hypothetical protein